MKTFPFKLVLIFDVNSNLSQYIYIYIDVVKNLKYHSFRELIE